MPTDNDFYMKNRQRITLNSRLKIAALCLAIFSTCLLPANSWSQPATISNPVVEGFAPDPSICRVGDDYYLCTSSFTWYPGLPIYHSRDLVNWQIAAHAIDRPGMVALDGVKDKDGVWAPTIRHHDGLFYIFCNVSNGGNFFITAKDVNGPWSDPIFIKDENGKKMPGIDPDIFWDDDGQSYAVGNEWSLKLGANDGVPTWLQGKNIAIWLQPIDLKTGTLKGKRTYISAGHAFNAKNAEGPHLYKIGKRYVLLVAEGGTDFFHAETVMTSSKITGPYLAQTVNPVLSNRQLGHNAPIQCVGHCDLVQTQHGDWYAVALGKRNLGNETFFTRETFLCPVEISGGELFFNPGFGCMTPTIPRPNLPWTPVSETTQWYYERIPHQKFDTWQNGSLTLSLLPESVDSLVSPALVLTKVSPIGFDATVKLTFQTKKANEQAGIVVHRNCQAYVAVLKGKANLQVVVCDKGAKKVVADIPYTAKDVVLKVEAKGTEATVEYGENADSMKEVASVSLLPLADAKPVNRFNGVGFGLYATSNGLKTKAKALFTDIAVKQLHNPN